MRRTLLIRTLLCLATGLAGWAQTPAPPAAPLLALPIKPGDPVQINAPCTEDDIQSLGMSCSVDEPCKIYLELSSLESLGNRIILAGNLHTSDITLSSILLVSEDGGKAWSEPTARIKSAALDAMQFHDLQNGWINGQLMQSFPKDPFFLVTRDGGKSWRNIPVYNESRAGAVDKFYFDNKDNGTMILDRIQSGDTGRYGLYETRTGGDSWELKQITQRKPELKKTIAHSTDWRLTPVEKTKIYRVEHRVGAKWEVVSSFKIESGECKVAERTLTPAPTETEETTKPAENEGVFRVGPATPPTLKKKNQ